MVIYLLIALIFLITEIIYCKVAYRYHIVDSPNELSSHKYDTVRGGGIIFIAAALAAIVIDAQHFFLAASALVLIGGISFLDDVYSVNPLIRIIFHFAAVTLTFYYLDIFYILPFYIIAALYIFVIGVINAYNFMDGINGITGLYSLVVLLGLQYINIEKINFIEPFFIWLPVIGCIVFLIFNFRGRALCFAGDVGSITLALWIVILVLALILKSGRLSYIFFLAVYGTDAIMTIIHRLILGQNIFKAHRLHFYQLLANENSMPQLVVAVLYSFVQAVLIFYLIIFNNNLLINFIILGLPLILTYLIIKPFLQKNNKRS